MSGNDDKDSQTEEASARKLQKAKEKGNVWSSKEPGHMMAYLGLLTIVAAVMPSFGPLAIEKLSLLFSTAGMVSVESSDDLRASLAPFGRALMTFLLPVLLVMLIGSVCAVFLSGPFVVALPRLQPKLSKLNPMAGLKRVFSPSNLVEFAKSLVKLVLIAALMSVVIYSALNEILPGSIMNPEALPGYIGVKVVRGLSWVLAVMIPVMVFDVFWKRMEFMKKQRMSKKDQKDEHKETEGDPHIKARRQDIGRRRVRQRIRKAVPEATLVVMNPTHYAVALRYERGVDMAPVCVAKGADLIALKIRDIALEHDVPVLESPPLARALHAVVEVDEVVPEDHWAAVAELVGYVLDLRRRIRRKLPEGTAHVQK